MTISPELTIGIVTLIVILIFYFFIYPRVVKSDAVKLAIYEMLASFTTVTVSGFIFWNSHVPFNLYYIDVNWFFFALLSYAVLEIPFMIGYLNIYKVWK